MLVDTHVHLFHESYDADRDAVVARAREAGVGLMIQPATDRASIDTALGLCDRYQGVYAMAGIHPSYVHEMAGGDLAAVEAAVADSRVLAVGETGLDYYWTREHVAAQQASLRAHARLAAETGLPIVLHNRDVKGSDACARDLVAILRETKETHPQGDCLGGVFHCFGGPGWLTEAVLDLGFYVGIGGTLTFKNAGVAGALADVPLDRIVLETDGPYLAPAPHRGGRNEPAYVALVAERLAEVWSLTPEAVAARTTATARRVFGVPEVEGEASA